VWPVHLAKQHGSSGTLHVRTSTWSNHYSTSRGLSGLCLQHGMLRTHLTPPFELPPPPTPTPFLLARFLFSASLTAALASPNAQPDAFEVDRLHEEDSGVPLQIDRYLVPWCSLTLSTPLAGVLDAVFLTQDYVYASMSPPSLCRVHFTFFPFAPSSICGDPHHSPCDMSLSLYNSVHPLHGLFQRIF